MEQWIILVILKISVMIIFFAIVSIIGTIPIRSQQFKQKPILRALGSAFAGALFLNVALLHILPQSADTIQQYLRNGDEDKQVFPLAYLLVIVGFLITVYFTKVFVKHTHAHDQHDVIKASLIQSKIQQQSTIKKQNEDHQHHHRHHHKLYRSNLGEAYLLTLAIYFHTIFQGIAIGVQNTLTGFLSTAVAIAFHKWADALSMGCHYRAKNVPKNTGITLIIIQGVLNVIAIGIGWIISSSGDIVQAIFLSISAGTFLAISTMQLLSESFHHRQYIHFKYFLLVFATAFVSGIWFFQNSIFSQDG